MVCSRSRTRCRRQRARGAVAWRLGIARTFVGLREGTLVSAVCVGLFVKAIGRLVPEKAAQEPHEIAFKEKSKN